MSFASIEFIDNSIHERSTGWATEKILGFSKWETSQLTPDIVGIICMGSELRSMNWLSVELPVKVLGTLQEK